jgi:uncharacterized glyoxalase superfamily protein PhnB
MREETAVRFSRVDPYLYYEDAEEALEWLSSMLGFRERVRYVDEGGAVQEAEMTVGDTTIHVGGAGAGYWERNGTTGPVGHMLIVHVDDIDAHYDQATAAGLDADPPENKPYGVRVYSVTDPGAHEWSFWQHLHDAVELPEGWKEIRNM